MNALDLAGFGGEPEGLRRNAEQARRLVQVEPWFDAVRCRAEDRDLVMRPVCGDPLPGPAIAMAGHQAVAVENAGDQIIAGDEHQLPDGRDDVGGGAVALAATPLRQAQFGMHAADPVDQQDDLGGFIVDIGDHFLDDGAHDALLEPGIRRRRRPDCPKVRGQRRNVGRRHR